MTSRAIRAATAADYPALLSIWERSVCATHDFLTPGDVEELRPQVATALGSGELEVWVLATATGEPLGWLGLSGAHIEALFLAPEARGAGGGRQLVAYAQERRPSAFTVDVNEQNPAATGFYLRLGFEVTGRSPRDSAGRPFPILHLRRPAGAAAERDRAAI
jgi:putative acetyltransferase